MEKNIFFFVKEIKKMIFQNQFKYLHIYNVNAGTHSENVSRKKKW